MTCGARKVVAVRLSQAELEQLDALVATEPKGEWYEPLPSRSSVIRQAIAERYTSLEARNTKNAGGGRNTSSSRK